MKSYIGKNCTIEIDGNPQREMSSPPRMTLRERTADWISGGALTDAREKFEAVKSFRSARGKLEDYAINRHHELAIDCREAQARLDRIAAQETPNASATVKRMARIARGEE